MPYTETDKPLPRTPHISEYDRQCPNCKTVRILR